MSTYIPGSQGSASNQLVENVAIHPITFFRLFQTVIVFKTITGF